jgi:type I restriction enzyme M protein
MLFLRVLDDREDIEATRASTLGLPFNPSLSAPYRWRDWASPNGAKRQELQNSSIGAVKQFVNHELIPHLKSLGSQPNAGTRQAVLSEVMSTLEATRVDTERNLLDVLDEVDQIRIEQVDDTHMFAISQVYERLLLRMGEKNNDGGQFFTPREVIRAVVRTVNPTIGDTIYDPACGTGGFLAQAHEYLVKIQGDDITPEHLENLRNGTFYGREKENLIYPIALANLILHGVDNPHIWHGNTLTGNEMNGTLFQEAPSQYDIILMNPPFGGREGQDAQTKYAYRSSSTQVLFVQEIIDSLKQGGKAGIIVDEGLLFRTSERAFVQTKRKLLDECDLWCIVSLPAGVFTQAGAGVKTNLLFFTKGKSTENVWYYDMSSLKVNRGNPLVSSHFDDFFALMPKRIVGENSWSVTREQLEKSNFDLKAANPNKFDDIDPRTPDDLLDLVAQTSRDIGEAVTTLRNMRDAWLDSQVDNHR